MVGPRRALALRVSPRRTNAPTILVTVEAFAVLAVVEVDYLVAARSILAAASRRSDSATM